MSEIIHTQVRPAAAKPSPSMLALLYDWEGVRKLAVIVLLALVWQAYGTYLGVPLLFPSFTETLSALGSSLASGELLRVTLQSLQMLFTGYVIGLALAVAITALAMMTRFGNDLLETVTSMLNPLPAIALLPLALIWFGLGAGSILFVLVHSVLWPVALNTSSGFRSVSQTLRMVGKNYGLSHPRYVVKILVPAAFPSILSGLKIGWAFAWRTLIAAELVFGVSSGSGGLGWFIYEKKNQLETPAVFAGLLTIMLLGVAIDYGIFRTIERRTVHRWGMHAEG